MQSRELPGEGRERANRWHVRRRRGGGPGRSNAGFAILAIAAIAAMVLSCGDGAVEPAPPPTPVATTVTVSPASATLTALEETARFTAEVRDQNGQVMAGAAIAWATSDASVASVDASGLATSAGNGTATITATAGSVSGTAAVTVAQAVSAVAVSLAADTLVALGDTVRLIAEATDANGHAVPGSEFSWSSSDTLVARVDASGLVVAVGNGAATITAMAGSVSGTAEVTVAQVVSAVAVSPAADTLVAFGHTVRLLAEATDVNGHGVAGPEFSWSSSDTLVARVDASGLVTAVGNGAATITATAGSVSGTAEVTVAQVVSAVAVSPAADTLVAFGHTVRLLAEATDVNGHGVAGPEFSWSSSDTLVARVDASGLVTAVGNGAATITATAGSVLGTAEVTVAQVVSAVAVSPAADTLVAFGDTVRLLAEATDANDHGVAGPEFSWSSNDTLVARVDASGLVTAVGNGAAMITATAGSVSGTAEVTVMASLRSAPPTYVFAGDIPESTRTLIRNEMEHSRAYFASEHGVEATGFTVIVGDAADALALASVYKQVTGNDLSDVYLPFYTHSLAWVESSLQGGAVVTIMIGLGEWAVSEVEHFIVHEYFHVLQGQLAREFEPVGNGEIWWDMDAPGWTVEGFATFADYKYSPTRPGRRAFLNDRYYPLSDVAEATLIGELDPNDLTWPLNPDRYTGCSWNVWSIYSLGFLATLFLSSQASDDAYVEFWKLLPRHATWEDAFSEAFGLDVGDFFRAFQTWLLPQLPTYDLVRMRVLWPERSTDPENPEDRIAISADEVTWESDDHGLTSRIGLAFDPPIRPPLDFEIIVPGGTVGTAVLSLWWWNEPTKRYLLGWYKDGALTAKREEATLFQFTAVSQNAEWMLPAHPTTLPRLACVQDSDGKPCS